MISPVTSPAGAAGRCPAYAPSLDPAELRLAAHACYATRDTVKARADEAAAAPGALASSGFAGPAADLAAARIAREVSALRERADALGAMGDGLTAAAEAQQALDTAAQAAEILGQYRLLLWLNQLSFQLDSRLARELNRSRSDGFERLAAHPDADLDELSRGYISALPEDTRQIIEAAGGLVLEAGPGSTTVMVGNATDPARVITMVAGATTGNSWQLEGELAKAQSIADRTGAAVVVWQGYNPPRDVPLALSGAPASEGAQHLSAFQAALEERYPDAQKTVVAHSYGTLVATRAAHEQGLLADDLWLLGSPGVDGESVADLTLAGPDSRVYVVDASRDPIRLLRIRDAGALGANPGGSGYGATAVEGVRGGHCDYFTDEAFLTAMSHTAAQPAAKLVTSAVGS